MLLPQLRISGPAAERYPGNIKLAVLGKELAGAKRKE